MTDASLKLSLVCLQDYNDHVAEISAKLVAIMDSMFEKSLSKVRVQKKQTPSSGCW